MNNLFKICTLLFGFILLLPLALSAQESERTIQTSVDLREGPGAYFELLLRLNRGANVVQIDEEPGWLQVDFDEQTGWIPDQPHYFEEPEQDEEEEDARARMSRMYNEMMGEEDEDDSSIYATPTEVAAAIRGFSRQYRASRGDGTDVDFSRSFEDRIDISDYNSFRRSRISGWSWFIAHNRFPLSALDIEVPEFTPEIETMGWGIASALAEKGLYENYEVQEYLQYVGLMVAESSHRYEIPVQIHILDVDEVVGYSAPNGIIFISKGALQFMESEAELAFFIGHELAHIVMQHGVQETTEREVHIRRDDAFSQLRQELDYDNRDDNYARVATELSEWADQVYEYLVSERLNEYEYEADLLGVAYAFRAGYDPSAAVDLLNRLEREQGGFATQIGTLEWEGTELEYRIENINEIIGHLNTSRHDSQQFESEYQNIKNLIR